MSIMDGDNDPRFNPRDAEDAYAEVEHPDTAARKLELENAARREAAAELAKKELADMETIIKQEQAARTRADIDAKSLLLRKAMAEKTIKDLTAKRLAKANEIGGELGLETFLTHFMMGGVDGDFKLHNLKVAFRARPIGVLTTTLSNGAYLMAARIEENPAFPTFFLAKGGGLTQADHELIKILQGVLQKYMKPYVTATPDTIKKVIEGF